LGCCPLSQIFLGISREENLGPLDAPIGLKELSKILLTPRKISARNLTTLILNL
jgi:hypothetical protein